MVAAGRLKPRQRLPPIRELAEQLALANGTVARAYRELERAGILETRGRAGTFVAVEPPVAFDVRERHEALDRAARAFAREVRQLDLEVDLALESARRALAEA
jgi:DNA-binding transcriptional regulator YhcF (GntR family)